MKWCLHVLAQCTLLKHALVSIKLSSDADFTLGSCLASCCTSSCSRCRAPTLIISFVNCYVYDACACSLLCCKIILSQNVFVHIRNTTVFQHVLLPNLHKLFSWKQMLQALHAPGMSAQHALHTGSAHQQVRHSSIACSFWAICNMTVRVWIRMLWKGTIEYVATVETLLEIQSELCPGWRATYFAYVMYELLYEHE